MTLEKMLPVIVAGLYLATGMIQASKGNWAAAGLWCSYALGNCFIVSMASR